MEKDDGEFSPVLWGGLEMNFREQREIHRRLPLSNRKSRSGFVLPLVIIAIIIIGIEMYVLAGMANTMQYQSHRAYLKACERNLLASGLAWARENAQKSSRESFDQPIQLDVSRMDIPGSALEVTLGATDDQREVRIQTSCRRGRQTLKNSDTYKIERYDQQKTTPGTRENSAGD